MKKYHCLLCGMDFEVEDDETPVCPYCGASSENVELIKEDKKDE